MLSAFFVSGEKSREKGKQGMKTFTGVKRCIRSKFGLPARSLALCLVGILISQSVSFAAGDTVTYGQVMPPAALKMEGRLANFKDFPQNFGRVKKAYKGTDERLVIQIQDAHASREGQRHTAELIQYFSKKYGANLVLLEGASGELTHRMFSSYPHAPSRRLAADYFMNQGILSGAEYLAWTRRPDLLLYGIEEKALYEENREAFLRMLEIEKKNAPLLETLRSGLESAASKVFPPAAMRLLRLKKAQDRSAGGLLEYTRYVSGLLNQYFPEESFPLIGQFLDLAGSLEKSKVFDVEQKAKDLSEGFFEELNGAGILLKGKLLETPAQKGLDRLLSILEIQEKMAGLSLTKGDAEFFYANRADFEGESFSKCINEVWREYGVRSDLPQEGLQTLGRDLKTAEHFYDLALKRDDVLSRRALERMGSGTHKTAILVTGGFHTPGIEKHLKEQGVSYWVVEPSLGNMKEEQREKELYEQNMKPEVSRLGRILNEAYEDTHSLFQKDSVFQLQTPRLMPAVEELVQHASLDEIHPPVFFDSSAPAIDFSYQALLAMALQHVRITGKVHPEILAELETALPLSERKFEIPFLKLIHDPSAVISTGGPDAGAYLSGRVPEFPFAVAASWKTSPNEAPSSKRFERGFEMTTPDKNTMKTTIVLEPALYGMMRRGVENRVFKMEPKTLRAEARKMPEFEFFYEAVPAAEQAAISRIVSSDKFKQSLFDKLGKDAPARVTVKLFPTAEKSEAGFLFYRLDYGTGSTFLKVKSKETPSVPAAETVKKAPATAPAVSVQPGLVSRLVPEILGALFGLSLFGFAPQALLTAAAVSLFFRAGYQGSLLTHEWSHLFSASILKRISGVFTVRNILGNRSFGEWLRGSFPAQPLPGGAHVVIPGIGYDAAVSRSGWMGAFLLFTAGAGLTAAASSLSVSWLLPLALFSATAGAGIILVKSVSPEADPEADCGVYGCGNYGGTMVQNEHLEPGQQSLTVNEFDDLVEEMSRLEVIRGEQADGEASYLTDGKQLTHVRKRIVKTRRGKIPKAMRASYRREVQKKQITHAFVNPLRPLKYPNIVTKQGHSRFGTTSRPAVVETQPHMGLPEHVSTVWSIVEGQLKAEKKNVATIVSHNGDFDYWELFGKSVSYSKLRDWFGKVLGREEYASKKTFLKRVFSFTVQVAYTAGMSAGVFYLLGIINPAIPVIYAASASIVSGLFLLFPARKLASYFSRLKVPTGDTPRLAEAIDLVYTQGRWDASIRLAYQFTVAKSLEDKAPSVRQLKEWGGLFDSVMQQLIKSGDLKPGQDGFSKPVFRPNSTPFMEQLKQALANHPSFSQWVPSDRRDAFLKEVISAFFENDLYRAVQIVKKKAEGSYGMMVTSTLEPGKAVSVASSQPMSFAFYPQYNLTLWSSEAAAVKVVFKVKGENQSMPYRFDLDQATGEIMQMEIAQGEKPKIHLYSEYLGRELTAAEVAATGRVIDMRSNSLIDPLPEFDWDNLVGRDISEISQVLDKIRRQWRDDTKNSQNRQTAFELLRLIIEKDIQKRIDDGINRKSLPAEIKRDIEEVAVLLASKLMDRKVTENELKMAVEDEIRKHAAVMLEKELAAQKAPADKAQRLLEQLSSAIKSIYERAPQGENIAQHEPVDILITGFEVSQWLGEQFTADLHKMFPQLRLKSVSANKILNAVKHANLKRNKGEFLVDDTRIGRKTIVLAISQSGQTFGTLNATIALSHILPGRVFALTGGVDTLMGQAVGQVYAKGAPFSKRIFDNGSGLRPAEPSSIAVTAAHATLTEILLYLGATARQFYSSRHRPLGIIYEEGDFAILRNVRDDLANHAIPAITGYSIRGPQETIQSPVKKNLMKVAKRWSQHVLENAVVTVLVALVVSSLVHFGIPFFPGQFSWFPRPSWLVEVLAPHLPGVNTMLLSSVLDAGWLIPVGMAYFILFSYPFTLALRAVQKRFPFLQRTGKRTITIGGLPFVHQIMEMFVSKVFALSYGFASLDVHGGNPRDHFLARFSHRVVRGSLLLLFRPDGRLGSQAGNESAVDMTKSQAEGIESFKVGAEVWTVGRNPKTKDSVSGGNIVLPDTVTALKVSSTKFLWFLEEEVGLTEKQIAETEAALGELGEIYAGKTIHQTAELIAERIGLSDEQFKDFEDAFYDYSERQFAVEQFHDTRFDSLEGMVAGFVVFEAIGRKVSQFFKWIGLVYDMAASQSRARIFTTRSPVSAADIKAIMKTMDEVRKEEGAESAHQQTTPKLYIQPEEMPFEVIASAPPATAKKAKFSLETLSHTNGDGNGNGHAIHENGNANGDGKAVTPVKRAEHREESHQPMLAALEAKSQWQNYLRLKDALDGATLARELGVTIPASVKNARMLLINYQPGVLNEKETLAMIHQLSVEGYQPRLVFYQDASADDAQWKEFIVHVRAAAVGGMNLEFAGKRQYPALADYLDSVSARFGLAKESMIQILHPGLTGENVDKETLAVLNGAMALSENTVVILGKTESVEGVFHVGAEKLMEVILAAREAIATAA